MKHPTHPNQKIYLKAPTLEQIMRVVNYHGVPQSQFERFYNMRRLMIADIRRGQINLPAKYWHIVYESLKMIDAGKEPPNFGVVPKTIFPPFIQKKTHLVKELL